MTLQRKIAVLGFVFFSFLTLYLLGHSSVFKFNTAQLSTLITIDVLLTVPLVYFLLIRKTTVPKLTVVPITIIGVVLASYIIPENNQQLLSLFKIWVLPVFEVFIIVFVLFKVVKTIKTFKVNACSNTDFYTIVQQTYLDHFPSFVARALATEICVFYYGFIAWKKHKLKYNEYTYHKTSGSISIFIGFILIIAAESVGVHYMLRQSDNQIGVWIITILSLYTAFQVFGFVKSILKRPIVIEGSTLHLRYGIMKESEINIKDIYAVSITTKELPKKTKTKRLSLLGAIESHNTILYIEKEYKLRGLYGITQKFKNIALSVDNPEAFKEALKVAKREALLEENI